MKSIPVAVLLLGIAGLSCSPSPESRSDRLLEPFMTANGPGGAVIVTRHDSVLYERAFGMAEMESGTPNTLTTNFRLASVTKQFTAMAVMMLTERGQLSLDQTLTEFFPDFAPVGQKITLRHLLTHTSGLVDYEDVMPESTSVPLLDYDVLQLIKSIDSTYSPPGSAFRYSNSAYALLALIVEQASHESFAQFLEENIFLPSGMTNTLAFQRGISEVSQRAYGYSPDTLHAGQFARTDQSMTSSVLGDGGIYSSIIDMRKWEATLTAGSLVSPGTMKEVLSRNAVIKADTTWYGYGWYVEDMDGVPVFYHDGSTVGFRTSILRIPERSLTIIMLFNRSDAHTDPLRREIARIFLELPS